MKKLLTLVLFTLLISYSGIVSAQPTTYCTAGYYTTCCMGFDKVEFNTISNTSSYGGGYENYISTVNATDIIPGGTYALKLSVAAYDQYLVAWIDWNADGDWTDAGELVVNTSTAQAYGSTYSFNVTVPATASPGKTVLRVSGQYGGMGTYTTNPCGQFYYGDVEDYTVNILKVEPQFFKSVYATHPDTLSCFVSQNYVTVLKSTIEMGGGTLRPFPVDTVWFSLTGTTSLSDIQSIRIFKKLSSPMNLADTIGPPIMNPSSNDFYVVYKKGTTLGYGENNLYIACDVSYLATPGHVLDCQLIKARVNDTIRYASTAGNPAYNKKIIHPKDYNYYCSLTRVNGANYLAGLERVIFGTIDHSSGVYVGTGNCVDFWSKQIPTVYKQKTYPITMVHAPFNSRVAAMWIDWNNNGFWESTELVRSYGTMLPATTVKDSITIPCTTTPGYHRMRISVDLYTPTVCGSINYGEAEDYLFYVAPEDVPSVTFSPYDPINYKGGITTFVPKPSIEGNIMYFWDYDNNGTWDDSTKGNGSNKFASVGVKTVAVKAVLTGCTQTFTSAVFKDTVSIFDPPSKPIVNFIASANTVTPSKIVQFTDLTSYGPYSWKWRIAPKYANGNPAFTFLTNDDIRNPRVKFNELGDYDITLVATNIKGTDSIVKKKYINVGKELIICTDISSNSRAGYLYDDAGPNGNYPDQSVTTTYKQCTFLIKPKCAAAVNIDFLDFDLCAWGSTGCPTLIGDHLKVFDGENNQGAPLHLIPKDILGNPIFPNGFMNGGGNINVTIPSLSASTGKLYMEWNRNCGGVGRGFEIFWSTTVKNVKPPVASISGSTNAFRLKTVKLASTSTGEELDYFWDLNGDGYNDTYDSATSWVYTATGTYKVRLVVQSCDYFDTSFLTIVVVNPTKKPTCNFEAEFPRVTTDDPVLITDKSDNSVYSWVWTITPASFSYIEGTTRNSQNPKLLFNKIGKYTVKLFVLNAVGADSLVKIDYINVYKNCSPGIANLTPDLGMSNVLLTKTNLTKDTLINNTSSIGMVGYTDYSNSIFTEMYLQGAYSLTLSRNTNFNPVTWTAFIDMNQDGTYSDNEKVVDVKNYSGTTYTSTFNLPKAGTNVFAGLAKLRIVANVGVLGNKGCGPNYAGEFEDYGIALRIDNNKPIITLLANSLGEKDTVILNSCGFWTDPGYVAEDDESGDITSKVVITGVAGIKNTVEGFYPLTYNVTDDAGNVADKVTRIVRVLKDVVPPTIVINGKNPDYIAVNPAGNPYVDPGAVFSDNCSGIKGTNKTGKVHSQFAGKQYITYNAEDNAGNKTTLKREVIVYDSIPPSVSLVGDSTIYMDVNTAFTDPWVTTNDNYDKSLTAVLKGTVKTNMLGQNFLSYCVTDSSGNGPVCVDRIVVVEDKYAPIIKFNQAVYIVDVFKPYNIPNPDSIIDNFWNTNNIIVTHTGSVNTFQLGDYTLTFTAIDASGNTSAPVSIIVRVVDRVAPEIELKGSSLISLLRWNTLKDPGVTISDNYYKVNELILKPSTGTYVSTQEIGLYTINYQVCDPSGNCSPVLTRFVYVDENIGIENDVTESNFTYYPNPVSSELTIEVNMPSFKQISIAIFNTLGENVLDVKEGVTMKDQFNVNVADLSEGVYYIRFTIGDNEQFNKKFVITR